MILQIPLSEENSYSVNIGNQEVFVLFRTREVIL
jgi:hypothetical protein